MKKSRLFTFVPEIKRCFFSLVLLGLFSARVFGQTEISTELELKAIANNLSGSYKLTNDIALTEDWVPIGSNENPFTGTIDGNGHIISGLNFNESSTNKTGFISVSQGATITRLGIENASIIGNADVGAIVGVASSNTQISECYVANSYLEGRDHVGSIAGAVKSGSLVINSYGSAYVYSRTYQAGGIAGIIDEGAIDKCYFSGGVYMYGGSSNAGGMTSLLDGGDASTNSITNSVTLASYLLGGQVNRIIGNTNGTSVTMANNYARADVLCGTEIDNATIVDTESETYGADTIQGANVSAADAKTGSFYINTLGWDMTNVWQISSSGTTYPILKWQSTPINFDQLLNIPTGELKLLITDTLAIHIFSAFDQKVTLLSGDENVIVIDTNGVVRPLNTGTVTITAKTAGSDDIQAVSGTFKVNVITLSGDIATVEDLTNIQYKLDGEFTLTADITLTDDWTPIANFTGILNGNGHIIHGLTFNDESTGSVGLFASTSGATITKLGIENANLVGNADVGGIVGVANEGTIISECYVANSYIEGRDHVGSIAGTLKSNSLVKNSYATTEVYSRQYQAGGISGILYEGSIDRCFFSGTVTIASGSSNAGGLTSLLDGGNAETNVISNSVTLAPFLIGSTVCRILANANGNEYTLSNNFSRIDVKRGSSLTGLEGIGTDDEYYGKDLLHGANVSVGASKTKAFYKDSLNWDMDNIWEMAGEDEIYPILKWQNTPVTVSVLSIPSDKIIKQGETVAVKSYGSMGQTISYSSPQEDQVVYKWPEYDAETGEISSMLFISDETLEIGDVTINISSEATSYMNEASASFTVSVVDPASLIKSITSVDELIAMKEDLIADYILKANLDLSDINWTPVGTSSTPFEGTFDGNGYKITGLNTDQSSTSLIGLFGVANGAVFSHVALEDVYMVGSQDVGGIVGKGIGVTISESYVTGYLEGNDHVGALVGGTYSGGTSNITNCYSSASVVSRNYQAGGLCGVASSTTIEKCYFSGSVQSTASSYAWYHNAGGLIALVEDDNVFISNTVSAATSVLGGTANAYVARGSATITDCLYRSGMSVSDPVGDAGADQPSASDARELTSFYQKATYAGLDWNFDEIWSIKTNEFPTLINSGTIVTSVPEIEQETKSYNPYTKNNVLYLSNVEKVTIIVYNMSGQLISNFTSYSTSATVKLPRSGIYLVRIVDNGKITGLKIPNF